MDEDSNFLDGYVFECLPTFRNNTLLHLLSQKSNLIFLVCYILEGGDDSSKTLRHTTKHFPKNYNPGGLTSYRTIIVRI